MREMDHEEVLFRRRFLFLAVVLTVLLSLCLVGGAIENNALMNHPPEWKVYRISTPDAYVPAVQYKITQNNNQTILTWETLDGEKGELVTSKDVEITTELYCPHGSGYPWPHYEKEHQFIDKRKMQSGTPLEASR